MIGHGSKFGRKKEQAIAALLSHRNVEESAKSNRNFARDAQAVDATTGIQGCLSGSPTGGGVPDQRPPAAERWRRRLGAAQTDGGPRYAAVHPGTYCAVHPGVRQQVSGTGKHGSAHSDGRCRNSGGYRGSVDRGELPADDRGRREGQEGDPVEMATPVDGEILADPVGFTAGILCHDIWRIPAQILESVAKNRRTAVKSCHASGKTFSSAEAVIWWITRYSDGIAVTTAPTWVQVQKLLWGEIRKSLPTSRIMYPKPLGTELKLAEGNYALGLSTNEGVRFQGFHAGHILFVLDEAPGIDVAIWEAIEGASAGGDVHILAIGNPVIAR